MDTTPNNVTPIKRGQSAASANQLKRMAKGNLVLKFLDDPALSDWPDVPTKFCLFRDPSSVPTYLAISKDRVVTRILPDTIKDTMWYYHEQQTQGNPILEYTDMEVVFKRWRSNVESIDEKSIADVAFADDPGLAWGRLPWKRSYGKGMPIPTIEELLSRISPFENTFTLKAWIGSLFDPISSRYQYVIIHGEGSNGKSRLLYLLYRVFQQVYLNCRAPTLENKFWSSGLVGKRVVAFPDCSNHGFITSDEFKSLTGDNVHTVEPKGMPAREVSLNCKFIIMTNKMPNITGSPADVRRVIACEIGPFSGEEIAERDYDEMLWKEAPGFIYQCIEEYKRLCPDGGRIPVDNSYLDEAMEENNLPYERFLNECFTVTDDPEDSITIAELTDKISDYCERHKGMREYKLKRFIEIMFPKKANAKEGATRFRDRLEVKPGKKITIYRGIRNSC